MDVTCVRSLRKITQSAYKVGDQIRVGELWDAEGGTDRKQAIEHGRLSLVVAAAVAVFLGRH